MGIIFEDNQFYSKIVTDRPKEASMPKTNSLRAAVSIEYQRVTDAQTDRKRTIAKHGVARISV